MAVSPFDVLVAAGSVWVTSYDTGTVARLEPDSGRLASVARVDGNPAGLTFCGGRVWVGHGRSATWITSIHRTTLRVRRIPVGATAPEPVPGRIPGKTLAAGEVSQTLSHGHGRSAPA